MEITFKSSIFLLLVSFLLKLNYEEKILKKHFKEYVDYQKRTKKLIPFAY